MSMNTHTSTRRRAVALALTALVAALSLSCALLDRPTPIAVPTEAATPAVPATTRPSPAGATATTEPTASATTPAPTATLGPTMTPSPTATPSPAAPTTERISFEPNTTYFTLVDSLAVGEVRRYVIGIAAWQYFELSVTPEQGDMLSFSLVGSDGAVVRADGEPFLKGNVPSTQDYVLTITNHGGAVNFGLSLMIPVRIAFAPGATTAQLPATQKADSLQAYVIRALAGQTMTARVLATQGHAILLVVGVDGTVLQSSTPQSSEFSSNLNSTQDYLILVQAWPGADARYTLEVSIPPLGGPAATPVPGPATRISFNPGATEATVSGHLPAGSTHAYVLGAGEGQLMEVTLWPASGVLMSIVGADGTVLMAPGTGFYRGVLPKTQDYTLRLAGGSETVPYNITVMLPVRVTFAPGATTAELTASLAPFTTGHYVVRALGGQTMTVETTTTQGEVILIVYGADGTVLQSDHGGFSTFTGVLPSTQDYIVDARSVGSVTAAVTFRFIIPPP